MINKVLATILYMSGLFDSKSIVKEVVWRKNKIRGGRLLIQGGDYIYIYIYIYTYTHVNVFYRGEDGWVAGRPVGIATAGGDANRWSRRRWSKSDNFMLFGVLLEF